MKKRLLFLFILAFSYVNAQYLDDSIKKTKIATIQNALKKEVNNGYLLNDLEHWVIQSDASSRVSGMWHYYLVQTFNGIEIRNAIANISIKGDDISVNNLTFVKGLASKIKTISPSISPEQALKRALKHYQIKEATTFEQIDFNKIKNEYTFNKTDEVLSDIKVKLVYDMVSINDIKLTWNVNLELANKNHWWNIRIDAHTGEFVSENDWVLSCDFGDHQVSNHQHLVKTKQTDSKINFSDLVFNNIQDQASLVNSYRALPYYIESPNHGDIEFIVSPQDPLASPNGWHDDGVNSYNTTRGNNIIARDDQDGNNGEGPLTVESSPGLVFDYPYGGPFLAASTYINAAQTNVFYVTNSIHDIFYQYGFDEASGNYQFNNFDRGGAEQDPVNVDSQDGAGVNNANFAITPDGTIGRMQMFLWNSGVYSSPLLEINNTPIAGDYNALDNFFSPGNVPVTDPITADLVLAIDDNMSSDPSTDINDGCGAITNGAELNGKIAVVRRGACTFVAKAIAAQNAGAIAVLIVNNIPGSLTLGGGSSFVSIPAYSINQADGENIIATMATNTVNATFKVPETGFVNTDGDFDNGVVSHEYGHGINTRLVGGRLNPSCVQAVESMGEGWCDYIGKIMTLKNIDNGIQLNGMGTFLSGQPIEGQGIRPFPFSGDISYNPMTYELLRANTSNNIYTIPHGVGAVWAGMLWDLTWDLIAIHGFSDDIFDADSGKGNAIALNLVIEGMKLTACNPGFEDGRDAILQADMNLYAGANQCVIWSAFARRGLGFSASQGDTNSTSDGRHAYDLPPSLGCTPDYLITNGDSGHKTICGTQTSVTFEFVFNEQNGYDTETPLIASNLPTGAIASFSPMTMKDTGLFTLTLTNIPSDVNNYLINITPGGDVSKTISASLSVNEANPDLTDGDTEFSIDGGNFSSFSNNETIDLDENTDVSIRVSPNIDFEGSAIWTGPDGAVYNSNNTVDFTNITDNDPAIEGLWTLVLSFNNDCQNTDQTINFNINIDSSLSVNDNVFDDLKIYPNPTNNMLTISGISNLKDSNIEIYDVTGRKLIQKIKVKPISNNKLFINMSSFSNGVYFVSIEIDSNEIVKRIIKN